MIHRPLIRDRRVEQVVKMSKADSINAMRTVAGKPLPTNEEDVISGGKGNDTIDALAGNDVVNGGEGADWLMGGPGNDDLSGGGGADRLSGVAALLLGSAQQVSGAPGAGIVEGRDWYAFGGNDNETHFSPKMPSAVPWALIGNQWKT